MSTPPTDTTVRPPARAPYSAPRLSRFGSLADLTQGTASINKADSGTAMAMNRSA